MIEPTTRFVNNQPNGCTVADNNSAALPCYGATAGLTTRHRRIRLEHRTQRVLERAEPGLVVAPLVDAFAVDRAGAPARSWRCAPRARSRRSAGSPARTAGRSSRAAGAPPLRCPRPCARRSRGGRGPAAPRRNAPSARRSRGSSGRCRRGVAEVLAAREVLLEVREAAGQRMPARIDDLRVRQDQVDQADVREVVRHLVDEERAIRLALDARALEVALARARAAQRRSCAASTSRVRARCRLVRLGAQILAPSR